MAELCQVLILTGAIFEYLRFEDPEYLEQFVSVVRRNRLADQVDPKNPRKGELMSLGRTLSLLVSGPTRNTPNIEGSELIKVRLPSNFVQRIDMFAKITKTARSATLTRFFERGLLLYIRSQKAMTMAMAEALYGKKHAPSIKTGEGNP